jgi:EAL domain-containing protein (putative c-di-GMP-specific phosphodiesterase class I)
MNHSSDDIKAAIEKGGLFYHYQPQIFLSDNSVRGYEALLRLQLGDHILPPAQILPFYESRYLRPTLPALLGLIADQVGQLSDGIAFPLPVISINMSAAMLMSSWFMPFVAEFKSSLSVPPSCIEFELTEQTGTDHHSVLQRQIAQLKAMGFKVALDDFGVGFSNFHYLSSLEVDTVKIDRTFISTLHKPLSRLFVEMLVKASRFSNFQLVAEGIEDQGAANMLKELGCHIGQGFLFGRPAIILPQEQKSLVG